MDLLVKDKSVIVTGASQGLGRAVATAFAKEGAKVFISSRNEEKLQQAVKEIRQLDEHISIDYAVCDMKNEEQIKSMVQKAVERNHTVDILINNAGGPPAGNFMDMDDEDWYSAFEQNLLSVIRTSKQVLPYMKASNDGGRIVNITSSSIKQSIDQLILSNTMRPGVLGLTKSLAREFAKDNILVNTVGPGKIATGRIKQLMETRADGTNLSLEEMEEKEVKEIPMGRLGKPEEFAKSVLFLGSFANTYITGQSLIVDGASVKAI